MDQAQIIDQPDVPPYSASDSTKDQSIVQPGAPLYSLPPPLKEKITKIDGVVVEGNYSDIYRGEWHCPETKGPKQVCLKYLRGTADSPKCNDSNQDRIKKRLLREVVIWKKTKHTNIYPFLGYITENGAHYLVSPWADHGSLDTYLLNNAGTPRAKKLEMLQQAAQGLAYLHELEPPIVHGDLKPANILVKEGPVAALCDFGVSRVIHQLGLHTGMTTAGGGVGTAGYQARELLAPTGDNKPTCESDMYAMAGVVLTVMSGQKPFWKLATPAAVVIAVYTGDVCSLDDHQDFQEVALWPFFRKCWDSTPSNRPKAREMINELDNVIESSKDSGNNEMHGGTGTA